MRKRKFDFERDTGFSRPIWSLNDYAKKHGKMKRKKYCPIVKDWIEAGEAIDKFKCFRRRKKGKIYRKLDRRLFRRRGKRH